MHKSFKRRSMKWAFAGLMLVPGGFNMAALTDLADLPIATLMASGSATIKHNLMFTLDDSGSMQQDYTPDYINDSMCFDSKDDNGSISNSLKPCMPGDPLFMSPDFNTQYYNPDIRYDPPKKADHSSYPHAVFTAAYPDPFNVQKKGMLQESIAGTVDLSNSWPDRLWCDTNSGGNCLRNTNGYDYPNDTYAYGQGRSGCTNYDTFYGAGSKCINYTTTAPYYWRIVESEYCTDEELTNCGPTKQVGVREVPSTLRWCTGSTLASCQARKLTGYDYPRNVGQWITGVAAQPGVKARYTITVSSVSRNVAFNGTLNVNLQANNGTTYTFYNGNFSGTTSSNSSSSTRNNDMACNKLRTKLSGLSQFSISCSGSTLTIEASNIGAGYNGVLTITKPNNVGSWAIAQTVNGKDATPAVAGARSQHYTMRRFNIDSNEAWGDKAPDRTDCAGVKCTFAEESRNFANWYSYYRTRMQAMKTAVSLAFDSLDDKLRIGFNSISYTGVTNGSKFLLNAPFDATQRSAWYSKLFASAPTSSTPLRTSLKKVGDMFSLTLGVNPYDSDPNKARCQRNYSLLTTDGYWNDSFSGFGNHDNSLSDPFIGPRSLGRYDGGANGETDTLADVAAYYYKTDLVPAMPDYVESHGEQATKIKFQNMTTHTLGLGVSGVLRYTKNYQNTGDFKKIKDGVAGQCLWSSSCDWPKPVSNTLTAVDDLWHAAVNGGGKYFSARNPGDLVSGMKSIVDDIKREVGSGAAAATSTPNITSADNWAFSATYTVEPGNQDWFGDLVAEKIDVNSGDLIPGEVWSVRQLLQANSTRRLLTFDSSGAAPRSFAWGSLTATEQGYFSNKGSLLTQYATLGGADQATLDSGANMFAFVAGDQTGIGTIFRNRNWLLGDIVHSKPAYTRVPSRGYTDSGYSSFVNSKLTRKGALYVGANDGMIHAFEGNTGQELWAYVPKMVMPNLFRLAEKSYATNHRFFVDGESIVADAKLSGGWKTLYVTGMGKGARGFVALDVTDPDNPVPLWEFCHDASLCNVTDPDVGYSFGNPILTKWKPGTAAAKWVVIVSSGYNNVSPGNGQGWLYMLDAETGAILSKTSTGTGSTTTPSGLGRINAWVEYPYQDNTALYVYGGDLNGDVWRFDLTATPSGSLPSQVPFIRFTSFLNETGAGQRQPVTTKPELVLCGGYRMVLFGTGRLLGQPDILNKEVQSIYGLVDHGNTIGTGANPSARNWDLVRQSTNLVFDANGNVDVGLSTYTNNFVNPAPGQDNGWFMDLSAGQRVNIDPLVGLGTLVMTANDPDAASSNSASCVQSGSSVTYMLAACSGALLGDATSAAAYKSDSKAGHTAFQLPDGRLFLLDVYTSGRKQVKAFPPPAQNSSGRRVSWRELIQ